MQRRQAPTQPNQSLINGLECLQQVVSASGPIGSRELARRIGMDHTRVNRLLGTLAYMGILEQNADRKYRPGSRLHILAAQSMRASGLLQAALPVLNRLRAEGLTVALGLLSGNQVCYLFHERPWQSLEEAIFRHDLWPVQCSSLGIALLAASNEQPPEFLPTPPGNSQPVGESLQHIVEARRRGFAELHFADGTVSLGVTIGEPPIAGLALSSRHLGAERIPALADMLRAAALEISANIDTLHTPSK